jgi:acyl-CoA synthetase (AMP-forming)/AMP-acid ligase II
VSIRGTQAGDIAGDEKDVRSVGDAIRRIAGQNPAAPALLASGLATCSYGELWSEIDQVGAALHAWGFDRNARIGLSLPTAPAAALAMLTVGSWAQAVPIDPNAPSAEVQSQLAFVEADAVVAPNGVSTAARRAAVALGIPVIEAAIEEGRFGLRLAMPAPAGTGAKAAALAPDADSILYILQTSGTTADPKHVLWTHRNQLAVTERLQRSLRLAPEDRALVILPIHHSFGVNTLWTSILTGGSVAFPRDPLHFDLAGWFGDLRPTWYRAVPAQHLFIMEKLGAVPRSDMPRSLRAVATGAAAFPEETRKGMRDILGFPVVETYGCTEAGLICGDLPESGRSKAGTVGRPDEGIVVIVDGDGRRLSAGEEGEILLGGPTVSPGYVNAPELNRKTFVDGWYRTGDIGSLDEDGFLTLRGRLKDVISRGAEKVHPLEVEETLRDHPQVLDVAVFGVPHERLGEDVAAAVVLRPGASLKAADLRKFLGTRLAWSKIPRQIVFVAELPKGAGGKVLRRVLQEMIGEQAV